MALADREGRHLRRRRAERPALGRARRAGRQRPARSQEVRRRRFDDAHRLRRRGAGLAGRRGGLRRRGGGGGHGDRLGRDDGLAAAMALASAAVGTPALRAAVLTWSESAEICCDSWSFAASMDDRGGRRPRRRRRPVRPPTSPSLSARLSATSESAAATRLTLLASTPRRALVTIFSTSRRARSRFASCVSSSSRSTRSAAAPMWRQGRARGGRRRRGLGADALLALGGERGEEGAVARERRGPSSSAGGAAAAQQSSTVVTSPRAAATESAESRGASGGGGGGGGGATAAGAAAAGGAAPSCSGDASRCARVTWSPFARAQAAPPTTRSVRSAVASRRDASSAA